MSILGRLQLQERARPRVSASSSSTAALSGPDSIAFLQYTGGTTGVAKAAVLTHRNMVANVLQTTAWIFPAMQGGGPRIVVTALPLYHIFALTTNCLAFLPFGARNILITNPRDFPAFVAELKKYKFNFISGVNTLLRMR